MREIKFRAWVPKTKQMSEIFGLYQRPFGDVPEHVSSLGKIIVMQFTGLKDKNGKDIYEGDILKKENDCLLKVFLQNGSFMYGFGNAQAEFMHEGWNYYSEIIGNIYENPNLKFKRDINL